MTIIVTCGDETTGFDFIIRLRKEHSAYRIRLFDNMVL